MNTEILRELIIDIVKDADDTLLNKMYQIHSDYTLEKNGIDSFEELPEIIQELLLKSREQVRQGKVRPHAEVMAKYRKKYNIKK